MSHPPPIPIKWVFTDMVAVFVILNSLFFIASITFSGEETGAVAQAPSAQETTRNVAASVTPVPHNHVSSSGSNSWISSIFGSDEDEGPVAPKSGERRLKQQQSTVDPIPTSEKSPNQKKAAPWWESIFLSDEEETSGKQNAESEESSSHSLGDAASLANWLSSEFLADETPAKTSTPNSEVPKLQDSPTVISNSQKTSENRRAEGTEKPAVITINELQKRRAFALLDMILSSQDDNIIIPSASSVSSGVSANSDTVRQAPGANRNTETSQDSAALYSQSDALRSLLSRFLADPEYTGAKESAPQSTNDGTKARGNVELSQSSQSFKPAAGFESWIASLLADPEAFSDFSNQFELKNPDLVIPPPSEIASRLGRLISGFLAETSEGATKSTPDSDSSKKVDKDPSLKDLLSFANGFLADANEPVVKGKPSSDAINEARHDDNGLSPNDFLSLASRFLAEIKQGKANGQPVSPTEEKRRADTTTRQSDENLVFANAKKNLARVASSFLADEDVISSPESKSESWEGNSIKEAISSFFAESEDSSFNGGKPLDLSETFGFDKLKSLASQVIAGDSSDESSYPEQARPDKASISSTGSKGFDVSSFVSGFFADPDVHQALSSGKDQDPVNEWVSESSRKTWKLFKRAVDILPPFFN